MSEIDFFICRADVGPYKPFQCKKARESGLANVCEELCFSCSRIPHVHFVALFSLNYFPGQYILKGREDKKENFPFNTVLDRVFSHTSSSVLFVSGETARHDHILKVLGWIDNPEKIKNRRYLKREDFAFDRERLSIHLL
jgi:hypothetical protein